MDKDQLRELIVDTLKEANLHSDSAVELLMLTAATESKLGHYIRQVKGPAMGVFQMEGATEDDIWSNYLKYKPELHSKVQLSSVFGDDELVWNLKYAILMARVHYLRVPSSLPNVHNIGGLAHYWKDHYNTRLGKGNPVTAANDYRRLAL